MAWASVDPTAVLGADFSSYGGYEKVLAQIQPVQFESGGSCGM